jgi:hypothetical protein
MGRSARRPTDLTGSHGNPARPLDREEFEARKKPN